MACEAIKIPAGGAADVDVTEGSVLFGGADGNIAEDNSNFFWNDTSNLLGIGLNAPASKLHIDAGNATASSLQFSAGTTTGQTATDGFHVGIASDGSAEIRQREGLAISFFTNNTQRGQITATGSLTFPGAGVGSQQFGLTAISSGDQSTALGEQTTASGGQSLAIGNGATANQASAIAIGYQAQATGLASTAFGTSSTATTFAFAVGFSSQATGNSSFAIGIVATANNTGSFALGSLTTSSAQDSVCIGNNSQSTALRGISLGNNAITAHADSLSIGHLAASTAANQVVFGSATTTSYTAFFLGKGVTAASPATEIVINATGGSGTNITGSSLVLAGGRATGNSATNGAVIIRTAPAGASGTTPQTLIERANFKKSVEAAFNDSGEDYDFRFEGDTDVNLLMLDASTDRVGIGTATPATKLEIDQTQTVTGTVTDGYVAGITLDPAYSAVSAQTVTRHNYIDVNQIATTNVTVTNAAVMRFDAAAGTHLAIDSGTTKTTPGTVNSWLKVNINGVIQYIPCYTSKTS